MYYTKTKFKFFYKCYEQLNLSNLPLAPEACPIFFLLSYAAWKQHCHHQSEQCQLYPPLGQPVGTQTSKVDNSPEKKQFIVPRKFYKAT